MPRATEGVNAVLSDLLLVLFVVFVLVAAFLTAAALGFLVLSLACLGGALAFADGEREALAWLRRS